MKKFFSVLSVIFLLLGLVSIGVPGLSETEEGVRLVCLNIGKADCMLLLYQDEAYLIDAGYAHTYPALQTALAQLGVARLNGVFLTHCHEDHAGGLFPLAQSDVPVGAWYAARIYFGPTALQHPAVLAAAQRNESVVWLDAGNVIPVGTDGSFTVLGPLTLNEDNENNNSLVMRFSSPQGSILLAGDMKEDEEYGLLAAGLLSPCDLLKAGHHGDNKATSKALLNAVMPKAAVILTSTLEEPDTPASSTLKRLSGIGCQVYVSQDYHDALLFTLKGGQVTFQDVQWQGVPERPSGVGLAIDVDRDTLTIINRGAAELSLSGCCVYSTKGNELISLPDVLVAAGGAYTIGSDASDAPVDMTAQSKRIWSKKKLDIAILYDAYGRPVACTNNGLAE